MASAIKLYLDEHVDPDVAKGLRRQEVDVLTTCAQDYVTWKNEYPEGADRVRGLNFFNNACTIGP